MSAANPRILVIAGTDSSGGAGLTRDTAMAMQLGCRVAPVVTAVTAQTSAALIWTQPVPVQGIEAQMTAALREAPVQAVKIGMLGSTEAAIVVAGLLPPGVPVVLDPVLKTSSGGQLGDRETLAPLLERTTLLTPNLMESAALSGCPETGTLPGLKHQAQALLATGPQAVLIKGGHGNGDVSTDHLFQHGRHWAYHAPRLQRGSRGTGCSPATAIACHLGWRLPLQDACQQAKTTVTDWLQEQQAGEKAD